LKRRMLMLAAAALVALAGPVLAQKSGERRHYDAQGRLRGTVERGSDGVLRTYDRQGRQTGRLECQGSACTRYDAQGRRTGRTERR
jgi:YD repeat-containing protein